MRKRPKGVAAAKNLQKVDKFKKIFKLLHTPEFETPPIVCIRAFLNKPMVRKRKVDIPIVEALRAFINMIKCNIIYRQFNFADILLFNPNKFVMFPFICDIFKWSPSRHLVLKIKDRQLDHSHRAVYRQESRKLFENSIRSISLTKTLNYPFNYDMFQNYLDPFKIIIKKFKLSHRVDEMITIINEESVLRQLKQTKLFKPPATLKRKKLLQPVARFKNSDNKNDRYTADDDTDEEERSLINYNKKKLKI